MGIEIERKFLVCGDYQSGAPTLYRQGYLCREPGRTVRVRIAGSEAWLTVKSLTKHTTRQEYEYAIPIADAEEMLLLCNGPLIEKYRWKIQHGDHLWEVDEFLGENADLVVAEIELQTSDEVFQKPDWVGKEVSDDPRYFNSCLSVNPFQNWQH